MATFESIEESNYQGTPILMYEFLRTSGGTNFYWRYNSSDADLLYSGNVYKATAISDDGVKQDSEAANSELNIVMPVTDDFPQMFRGNGSTPSDTCIVTIRRLHVGTVSSVLPGIPIWSTATNVTTADGSVEALGSGASMAPDDAVFSPSVEFELRFQADGNLVLYRHQESGDTVLWSSGTDGSGADSVVMQTDGNLVIYNGATPVWESNTDPNPGATLVLQNDGNLVIYTAQVAEPARVFWVGTVIGVSQTDEVQAKISCQMLLASFKRGGLRLSYVRGCPHALYDSQCTVNPNDRKTTDNVVSFDGNTITFDEVHLQPNGWFDGGYLEWTLPSGMKERRAIVTHSGDVITVQGSTFGITAGDLVDLFPGCRRTRQVCNDKFLNILNYGGFPDTPGKSPFSGDPVF